jgi:hypothetical protein
VLNPYAILGGSLAVLLAIGGSYIYGRHDGRAIEYAKQAKVEAVAQRIRDEVALKTAEQIAAIQIRHTTIRQKVETEIRENTVYRDCRHSDDALRLLNSALENSAPIPADGGELPAADDSR